MSFKDSSTPPASPRECGEPVAYDLFSQIPVPANETVYCPSRKFSGLYYFNFSEVNDVKNN